ncbi:hypothetical protein [Halobacteriovorax sp.]|uniref:hypothetical protein n=1 Tax=Halobacteriovorax sp. TaxID=2020862 RepID=UPI003AF2497F
MKNLVSIDWFKLVYGSAIKQLTTEIARYLNLSEDSAEYKKLLDDVKVNENQLLTNPKEATEALKLIFDFIINHHEIKWKAITNFFHYKEILKLSDKAFIQDESLGIFLKTSSFQNLSLENKKDIIFLVTQIMMSEDHYIDNREKKILRQLLDELKFNEDIIYSYALFLSKVYPNFNLNNESFTLQERKDVIKITLSILYLDSEIDSRDKSKISQMIKRLGLSKDCLDSEDLIVFENEKEDVSRAIKSMSSIELTATFFLTLETALLDNKLCNVEKKYLFEIVKSLINKTTDKTVGIYAHLFLTSIIIRYDIPKDIIPLIELINQFISRTIPNTYNRFESLALELIYFNQDERVRNKLKLLIKCTNHNFVCPDEQEAITEGSEKVVEEIKKLQNLHFNESVIKEMNSNKKLNQTQRALILLLKNREMVYSMESMSDTIEDFLLAEVYLRANASSRDNRAYQLPKLLQGVRIKNFPEELKDNILNTCFILFMANNKITEKEIADFEEIVNKIDMNYDTFKKLKKKLSLLYIHPNKLNQILKYEDK